MNTKKESKVNALIAALKTYKTLIKAKEDLIQALEATTAYTDLKPICLTLSVINHALSILEKETFKNELWNELDNLK